MSRVTSHSRIRSAGGAAEGGRFRGEVWIALLVLAGGGAGTFMAHEGSLFQERTEQSVKAQQKANGTEGRNEMRGYPSGGGGGGAASARRGGGKKATPANACPEGSKVFDAVHTALNQDCLDGSPLTP